MDKISVIIPCYNAEKYITKCLDSIINQTYGIENLEVICINDASTDSTFDILCSYENKYPESFLIIDNEQNARQGYARNLAIQYSSGNYIFFVDSDDYVDITIIEKLYNQMIISDYDYVSCHFYRVSENTAYIIDNEDTPSTIYDLTIDSVEERKKFILNEESTLGCWATLYNKSFILENNIVFAEGIVYEDLLWLGIIKFYAKHICIIPDRLYYYVNYNNTSVVSSDNSNHHFDRLKSMKLYLSETKRRGFYEIYKDEIDMHFIWIYYINSLILFARRMSTVPAEILNDMIKTINAEIPDYNKNPHIQKCEGIAVTILSLIDINPTTQISWDKILSVLKDI